MPIYEYQCGACGHQMEAFQKMSEDPLIDCPECKKATLQKLISAAGFQLKGTGWYATDFKNKGKPESGKSDSTFSPSSNTDQKKAPDSASAPATKADSSSSSSGTTDTKAK